MAKRIMAESKEAAQEIQKIIDAPVPDITFTEAEVQGLANFVNYVYLNGTFPMKLSEFKKISGLLNDCHALVGKMEKYIFEYRRSVKLKEGAK